MPISRAIVRRIGQRARHFGIVRRYEKSASEAGRLMHHILRQARLPRYRIECFASRVIAPDLQHRLQYQYPDLAVCLMPSGRA
jgi:hypothetical protein